MTLETPVQSIILIGKAGSGKSSIANMLSEGDITPQSMCEVGDDAQRVTSNITTVKGRKWTVCDTVGLGDLEGEGKKAVDPALDLLREALIRGKRGFHHIAYVVPLGKLTTTEHKNLYALFKATFAGAEENFVLLITHCPDRRWVDDNMEVIKQIFGDIPVAWCSFPFYAFRNSRRQEEDREERMKSLTGLEEQLWKLNRMATVPKLSDKETADDTTKENFEKALRFFLMVGEFITKAVLVILEVVLH
ncbi:hypothetical protein BGZ99_005354 [Dissophora globulifera]|uniref:AIG1-type G domain-containing protein n=1 Tax=Dissophora globulifera TaxID=979702 RepID=A0A9P6RGB6_9FUNG|nr:hypothetical protein BGZ99_005354 [Dissophora globulifera]